MGNFTCSIKVKSSLLSHNICYGLQPELSALIYLTTLLDKYFSIIKFIIWYTEHLLKWHHYCVCFVVQFWDTRVDTKHSVRYGTMWCSYMNSWIQHVCVAILLQLALLIYQKNLWTPYLWRCTRHSGTKHVRFQSANPDRIMEEGQNSSDLGLWLRQALERCALWL